MRRRRKAEEEGKDGIRYGRSGVEGECEERGGRVGEALAA